MNDAKTTGNASQAWENFCENSPKFGLFFIAIWQSRAAMRLTFQSDKSKILDFLSLPYARKFFDNVNKIKVIRVLKK
jgi:hypothetical protein